MRDKEVVGSDGGKARLSTAPNLDLTWKQVRVERWTRGRRENDAPIGPCTSCSTF